MKFFTGSLVAGLVLLAGSAQAQVPGSYRAVSDVDAPYAVAPPPVPGPHYETDAELEFLAALGGGAVSMSGPPELLAAGEEGLDVAALSLIVNAGHTSHGGVLAGAEDAAAAFGAAVSAVLSVWGY
jgi:purine nucleoside phosphorylase